jgi:hypothetical protein
VITKPDILTSHLPNASLSVKSLQLISISTLQYISISHISLCRRNLTWESSSVSWIWGQFHKLVLLMRVTIDKYVHYRNPHLLSGDLLAASDYATDRSPFHTQNTQRVARLPRESLADNCRINHSGGHRSACNVTRRCVWRKRWSIECCRGE